jgi:hypothetical protein
LRTGCWKHGDKGRWVTDDPTRWRENRCGVMDQPAHVDINLYSTGTCVDYGISTATLLRKSGLKKEDAVVIKGEGHGYSLVRFPGDKKWIFVDTTGNSGQPIKYDPTTGYQYCTKSEECYNDAMGMTRFCLDIAEHVVGCGK